MFRAVSSEVAERDRALLLMLPLGHVSTQTGGSPGHRPRLAQDTLPPCPVKAGLTRIASPRLSHRVRTLYLGFHLTIGRFDILMSCILHTRNTREWVYTHTHVYTHIHTHTFIYLYMCACIFSRRDNLVFISNSLISK